MFLVPVQQPATTSIKRKPRVDHQQTTAVTSFPGDEMFPPAAGGGHQQRKASRRPAAAAAGTGQLVAGGSRRLYGGGDVKDAAAGRVTMATLGGMYSHSLSSFHQQDRKAWILCFNL